MNSNYIYKKTEKNFERKDELNRIVTLLNKNYQSFQEKYNINEISIIGSFARGEQTEESDLDIMVDFTKPIGWEVVDLRDELEKLLGMKVDLIGVTQMSLQKCYSAYYGLWRYSEIPTFVICH